MTSLTSAAELSKKALKLSPFLFAVFLLVVLIVLRFSPKKTPPPQIEKPIIKAVAQVKNSFDLTNVTIPTTKVDSMPTYNQNPSESLIPKAQEYAIKLNFENPPERITDIDLGEGLTYTKNGASLSVYKDSLTLAQSAEPTNLQQLNTQELEIRASQFLIDLGSSSDFSTARISYVKATAHDLIESDDPTNASYVKFYFSPKIATYPLLTSGYQNTILLDFKGNVLQLFLRNFAGATEGQESYPILDADEAKSELVTGQSFLINLSGPDNDFVQKEPILIKKIYLAYYLPSESRGNIQPVWVFEGESTNEQTLTKLTYIATAIRKQFFKP